MTDKDGNRGGVVDRLLKPMGGEHHDFFRWGAANRAERLMGEGRENQFTQGDIDALKTLGDGTLSFDYMIQNGVRKGQKQRSGGAHAVLHSLYPIPLRPHRLIQFLA